MKRKLDYPVCKSFKRIDVSLWFHFFNVLREKEIIAWGKKKEG
jgi:hypothetical protein